MQKIPTISHKNAVLDIACVIVVSILLYMLENTLRAQGVITLPEDSRGVFSVLGGCFAALMLLKFRGQSLREIGFFRPKRLWTIPLWAIGITAAYIIGQAVIVSVISLIVDVPDPNLNRHNNLYQNLPLALFYAVLLPFTASIPEEIIYRGFLMNRFSALFGTALTGTALSVIGQGLIFGLVHFQWGVGGILVTTFMGMIWGIAYVLAKRNLWIVIAAHSFAHLLFIQQLYITPA